MPTYSPSRIVRAQVLPSGKETGRQNYIAAIGIHLYGVAVKSVIPAPTECTRSAMRYRTLNCNKTTMYYSIDMNFFNSKGNLGALQFKYDQARRRFVEWAQNKIAVVPNFHERILFSDEAHFWLNGYVNKQNCRIWSEANPQVYVETPLHPEKLTV
ncbi:hypothetical protein TNCV_2321071 [Trichonephila clavipes]|nr:hypothetical protein TNCV_2321071 [Trichonephila clavipes]